VFEWKSHGIIGLTCTKGQVTFSWPSLSGSSYLVLSAPDPGGAWVPLAGGTMTASGTISSFTDPTTTGVLRRF